MRSVLQHIPQFSSEGDNSNGVPTELPVKAGLSVLQVSHCWVCIYWFTRGGIMLPHHIYRILSECILLIMSRPWVVPASCWSFTLPLSLRWDTIMHPQDSLAPANQRYITHTLRLQVLLCWPLSLNSHRLQFGCIISHHVLFFQSIFQPSELTLSLAKECVSQGCGVHMFVLSQQDVGGAWPGHIPNLTGGALHTYSHLQVKKQRTWQKITHH